MKETDIQREILQKLHMNGLLAWRNQQIPVPIRRGSFIVGLRAADPFTKGQPDIMVLSKGTLYGIEVKKPGGKQSVEQKLWQQRLINNGGVYILAYSWNEVQNYFDPYDDDVQP